MFQKHFLLVRSMNGTAAGHQGSKNMLPRTMRVPFLASEIDGGAQFQGADALPAIAARIGWALSFRSAPPVSHEAEMKTAHISVSRVFTGVGEMTRTSGLLTQYR